MSRPPPGPGRQDVPPFDARSVDPLDWGILASGALAFVFSLFDYYRWYVPGVRDFRGALDRMPTRGVTVEISAWHGFFGWAATLLAVGGAAAVALEVVAPHVPVVSLRAVSLRRAGAVAFALATLSVVLAGFVGSFVGPLAAARGVETERGVGYWASLVVIAVGAVAAALRCGSRRTAVPRG